MEDGICPGCKELTWITTKRGYCNQCGKKLQVIKSINGIEWGK